DILKMEMEMEIRSTSDIKYKMVFVPFTAINNHRRFVTIGSGLLKKETAEAYGWLLRAFKKAFVRPPNIVFTDQDGVMRLTVAAEFPESKHRLCMWHIMQKIPAKLDEQELEAHYMYMEKIKEVLHVTDDNSGPTYDTAPLEQIQKQLRKANATLTHELNESKYALTESNDIRDRCRSALHQKEVSYDKDDLANIYTPNCDETLILEANSKSKLDKDKVNPYDYTYQNIIDIDWQSHLENRLDKPITHEITVLIKNLLMPLAEKTRVNTSEFERVLKEEMFDDLQYVQSLEKELEELQYDKTEFLDEYDLLYRNASQLIYVQNKECERLEIELSKQTENASKEVYIELLRSFAKLEKHSISLELALQQCQEHLKNDRVWKQQESTSF
ncbi:retrovirus-related pol polyprotein from transposon TNT 1-94, partial [Tanacetum coccineum]